MFISSYTSVNVLRHFLHIAYNYTVTISRYQEQVSTGLRREHQLEQLLAQLELDAQHHQERWQSKQLDHQQQLVEQLTSARDHVSSTTGYYVVNLKVACRP